MVIWLIIAVVFAPLMLAIIVLNPFGFQWIYVSQFCIVNHINKRLWITPIGTYPGGSKSILEQFIAVSPAIWVLWRKNRRVRAGHSKWFAYERKGLETYEIVVCNEAGEYRQLVIDPAPTSESVRFSKRIHSIESWDELIPVGSDTLAVVLRSDPSWSFWAFFLLELLVTVLYCWWLATCLGARQ